VDVSADSSAGDSSPTSSFKRSSALQKIINQHQRKESSSSPLDNAQLSVPLVLNY